MTAATVVAFVSDLMDRSRIAAAVPDCRFAVPDVVVPAADVFVVDLARYAAAIPSLRAAAPAAWIIAFGPHVDDTLAEAAADDGANVVMPRSRFFRDVSEALSTATRE